MKEKKLPRPTDAELAILRALWKRGEATVREIHEDLQAQQATGYTTVLKLMQIMADKGLVLRDETQRAHIYRPAVTEQKTQKQLVSDLLQRAFGGSSGALAMQALASRPPSSDELAQLRHLLDELEGDGK